MRILAAVPCVFLLACASSPATVPMGDASVADSETDAASDAASDADSDAGSDAFTDAGPACVTEFAVEAGILDVTRCGTRPDGASYPCVTSEMSAAVRTSTLRTAMVDARDNGWILYFPPGDYVVTTAGESEGIVFDCRQATSGGRDRDGRMHPCFFVGSVCGESRIVLDESSEEGTALIRLLAFDDGGVGSVTKTYNNEIRNLVLDTTAATNAIGIIGRAAEGTAIHDVAMRLGAGGIGIQGGPGSGGSIVNIRISGGSVGLDYRTSQPTPTAFALTLEGQTNHAVVYSGWQAFVGVGVHVVDFHGTSAFSNEGGNDDPTSMLALVDSVVEFDAARSTNVAVAIDRSTYLENVFVRNATWFASTEFGGSMSIATANDTGWAHIDRGAIAVEPPRPRDPSGAGDATYPLQRSSHTFACDGAGCTASSLRQGSVDASSPVADLAGVSTRHGWPRTPTFEAGNAHWVFPDGDDDRARIQAALDIEDNAVVVLAKGVYLLDAPVTLHSDSNLVGLGSTISVLEPDGRDGTAFHDPIVGCPEDPSGQCPIVMTDDDASGATQLSYLGLYLDTWFDQNATWAPANGVLVDADAYMFRWRSGANSLIRGVWTNGWASSDLPLNRVAGGLMRFEGGGRFFSLVAVQNEFSRAADFHVAAITGNRPKVFYHFVPSHSSTPATPAGDSAAVQIVDAENVDVFGVKYEHVPDLRGAPVMTVDNSSRIRIVGHGGIGYADEGRGLYQLSTSVHNATFACLVPAFEEGLRTLSSNRDFTLDEAAIRLTRPAIVVDATSNSHSTSIGEYPALYELP